MAKAARNMAEFLEKQSKLLASSGLMLEAAQARNEARQLRLLAEIHQD